MPERPCGLVVHIYTTVEAGPVEKDTLLRSSGGEITVAFSFSFSFPPFSWRWWACGGGRGMRRSIVGE